MVLTGMLRWVVGSRASAVGQMRRAEQRQMPLRKANAQPLSRRHRHGSVRSYVNFANPVVINHALTARSVTIVALAAADEHHLVGVETWP